MNAPLTPQDWELLSAYLDGQLPAAEHARVRELLDAQAEMQAALEALRRTRQVLRAAPRRRAPRNFTLTPAMARQLRRPSVWSRWSLPSFSFASALATLLLVLSFVFRPALAPLSLQMVPMMAAAPGAAQDQAQPEAQPQGGPIIHWQNAAPPAASGMGAAPTAAPRMAAEAPRPSPTLSISELVQPTLVETLAAKAVSEPTPALREDTATSPILGIAPTEERGQVIVPTEPTETVTYSLVVKPPEPDWTWEWLQAGLALTALLSGAIAAWLWWRARR